jgi:hypothetical protein
MDDSAVFDAALIPKYAVVIVEITVNALLKIDTTVAAAVVLPAAIRMPSTAAMAIAVSPVTTIQSPARARVI